MAGALGRPATSTCMVGGRWERLAVPVVAGCDRALMCPIRDAFSARYRAGVSRRTGTQVSGRTSASEDRHTAPDLAICQPNYYVPWVGAIPCRLYCHAPREPRAASPYPASSQPAPTWCSHLVLVASPRAKGSVGSSGRGAREPGHGHGTGLRVQAGLSARHHAVPHCQCILVAAPPCATVHPRSP